MTTTFKAAVVQMASSPDDAPATAETDPAEVACGKFDVDVMGHYARPDIFSPTVDTRAKPAVRGA